MEISNVTRFCFVAFDTFFAISICGKKKPSLAKNTQSDKREIFCFVAFDTFFAISICGKKKASLAKNTQSDKREIFLNHGFKTFSPLTDRVISVEIKANTKLYRGRQCSISPLSD